MRVMSFKSGFLHHIHPFENAASGQGIFSLLKRLFKSRQRYGLSPSKVDEALTRFSTSLRWYNARATLPITVSVLAQHLDLIYKYQEQGLEFTAYGLPKSDFNRLSLTDQQARLEAARRIFAQSGIRSVGFRYPGLSWNAEARTALKADGILYDNSEAIDFTALNLPQSKSYAQLLKFHRAASAEDRPVLPWLDGNLVRIPYCLPDDEALLDHLADQNEDDIARVWTTMLDQVHLSGELLTLGLHPERIDEYRRAMESVLAHAHTLSPTVWFARLDEVADWWQALAQVTFEVKNISVGTYEVKINLPFKGTVLVRQAQVKGPVERWDDAYQRVQAKEFRVQAQGRPFIGVAPDCAPELISFLRQQGYLVEVNPEVQAYRLYFNRPTFGVEDQRELLATIENSHAPLIRVGRWPDGARCAMSITGTVDALTLMDYLRRLFRG